MRNNKSRGREYRTKSKRADETTAIRVKLSGADYDRVKAMERKKVATKEEIFRKGLEACSNL